MRVEITWVPGIVIVVAARVIAVGVLGVIKRFTINNHVVPQIQIGLLLPKWYRWHKWDCIGRKLGIAENSALLAWVRLIG